MKSFQLLGAIILQLLTMGTFAGAEEDQVNFRRDIRGLLSDTCFKCHGPGTQQGGFRFDLLETAFKPAASGKTPIVAGNPQESELIRRINSQDSAEAMPPASSLKSLTQQQKELLSKWIAQGAAYEGHWSFQVPRPPLVPASTSATDATAIDAFLLARLQASGLSMNTLADRETLIRRVSFALTGLPPTLDELDTYLSDKSPGAYERLIDRYLASPRFGEEMARHWLDAARYADTHGLHLDNERQMWAYRDWVISAFNQNMPFDAFTIEQLAGDLLPNPTVSQLVATGFNRCNVTTSEGGSIDEEWVFRNAVDRTVTMSEIWMGLTTGCCVCHDHKFDPISARDFYSLYAFFHSAADPPLDGNALLTAPTERLVSDSDTKTIAALDEQIRELNRQFAEQAAATPYADPATNPNPPPPQVMSVVWFDDDVPAGGKVTASPGHPTTFVTAAEGQVQSGSKALKRVDPGLAQDVFEGVGPLEIPPGGKLFAHVFIDPQSPPKTLMLQYHKNGWLHRAVWGDYEAIDWGTKGTTERVLIGELPQPGSWQKLELAAETVGLKPGDQITGFAFTQFGGTVFWDQAGIEGTVDPVNDPRKSFLAWRRQHAGKDVAGLEGALAAALKAGPDAAIGDDTLAQLRSFYLHAVCLDTMGNFQPIRDQIANVTNQKKQLSEAIPSSFVFKDLPQPRESFIMLRGQYNKPGDKVEPNVPAVLTPLALREGATRRNRLDLANWLVSADHPLTARVTVNRLWQQVFGVGLVKTSFDFGAQGEPPSHPELLDYLAVSFRESGWNVKKLIKELLMTQAFRQSAVISPEALAKDPENRLLSRGPRIRLDAEQIRDNSLYVGRLLNLEMGGRGVHPYQPPNIWEPVGFVGSNTSVYAQDHGDKLYRRSIYTFLKRTAPPPFMSNFDAPNREQFCARRERTNTPLQALQLMNDVQHVEAARGLAQRMMLEGGSSPAERIVFGYRVVLARVPSEDEKQVLLSTFSQALTRYQSRPEQAKKLITNGESVPNGEFADTELASYTLLANLLLNLDETVNRN